MPTATAPQLTRRAPRGERLRRRADWPPAMPASRAYVPCHATHDFLVPNPRPDLTLDPHTLRMLEVE